MTEKINVRMSECEMASGDVILETLGLGSCVAICIYSKEKKLGGLAHIMLPHRINYEITEFRFADEAIFFMLKDFKKNGCENKDLVAKIVGGASMFEGLSNHIGQDNVETIRAEFEKQGVKIAAEEVFGNHGRSIWFDLNDGDVVVSTVYGATVEI
ncbi:chemotaxis protein CheD [Candidatus Pacearchaeota archaeon]|nr:chemotaxis protein CheD [Candidatus Pacearchaeota archaeon]